MPKKSNTKRADGRIAVQVYLGVVDGKRKYKTVYGSTQKEANQKADELKAQLNKGIPVFENDFSFCYWAKKYSDSEKPNVTPSVLKSYNFQIEYFNEFIGDKNITKIMQFELQNIINEYAELNPTTNKPSSKKSVIKYKSTLNHIFKYAMNNRVIDFNPAESLKIPKMAVQGKKRTPISKEQQQWVVDTPHYMQTAAMIMMYAGLRRGELTALLWPDIDLKNKKITVYKNYDFRNKDEKGTKTESGMRTIPIPDVLFNYLKKIKRTSLYVVTSKNNTQMLEGSWFRLWESYMKCLNAKYGDFKKINVKSFNKEKKPLPIIIDTFTPHQLRHTYCTMLYDAGVDVVTAKELMGHKDIQTTLGIYTHLTKEKKEKDISKLNLFLSNASQMQVKTSKKR